jgi:hypothetical protein
MRNNTDAHILEINELKETHEVALDEMKAKLSSLRVSYGMLSFQLENDK